MVFAERQWERLLTGIADHQFIPIVGPELLVRDEGEQRIKLYQYLAQELVNQLNLDKATSSQSFTLDEVVREYLRKPDHDLEELYFSVREIMDRCCWPSPEPLKKLSKINHFDVYLSITFDSMLEQSLNEIRFKGVKQTRSLAYSKTSSVIDLPSEYRPSYDAADKFPSTPAVYHLFGKVNHLRDFALREEDILQFCTRLQSRDLRPQNLFDLLRKRRLLFIGCSFPGWLTRFFLAVMKGDHLFMDGVRGLVADSMSVQDIGLVYFLERQRTSIYTNGDGEKFLNELSERWRQRFGDKPQKPPATLFEAESIFLSYAREDQTVAYSIRDTLKADGLDVWLDETKLEPGDDFREVILRNIERCSYFLPVISHNANIVERRFFHFEWDKAVDEARFRAKDYPFIQPIVIDDTPPDSPHIPRAFRERHWQRMEAGRLPTEFVDRMRQLIRDLRREKMAR